MKTEQQAPVPEPARGHDVFVSYSRADREAVVALTQALTARGKRAWVDLENIPPSAEWMAEIRSAIESSDSYLVAISPDLARSQVCAQELEHAEAAGKRIVPVLVRPTDPSSVPSRLAALNWIDVTGGHVGDGVERIVQALDTDLDHVRAHTRLLVRASEWDGRQEPRSLLLRGDDLKEAEALLVAAQGKEPAPTPMQARFVQASRQGASHRQRAAIAIAVVVALVAASLGLVAWQQRGEAIDQRAAADEQRSVAEQRASESRSRELAAASVGQLDVDPELSLLLASEAMQADRTPEAVDALRQAISESRVRATFTGHEGPVSVVTYSPDGATLLTASYDGTARIWDVAGEQDPVVLTGHTDLLVAASFSPDGTRVATASFDGTARVWDAETGAPLTTLEADGGAVNDVAFTPDGAAVITADGAGAAIIWDSTTGERIHAMREHARPIYDVDVGPDGSLAVTASDDDTAKVWDLQSGRLVHTLSGHTDGLYVARFSPDGSLIVTGGEDGDAKLWDVRSGRVVLDLVGSRGPVVAAAFAPSGKRVAVASEDHIARIWDIASGRVVVLRGHQDELNSIAFAADGSTILTTSNDATARVWDAGGGAAVAVLRGHRGQVLDGDFSPDGVLVATAGEDGSARTWEPSTGRVVFRGGVSWVWPSPDGSAITVAAEDGRVVVIDATGEQVLEVDAGLVQMGATVTADATLVVSASYDGVGHVWDLSSGELVADLTGHEPAWTVTIPVEVPDRAFTFSDDGTARLWDATTGEEMATFDHGTAVGTGIWDAALSTDGSRAVTAGTADGVVRMWDADTGEELWSVGDLLSGFSGISVDISSDGGAVAAVSAQTVVLDAATGEGVAVLESPDLIRTAKFSPDGSAIASQSDNGAVRLWDARTGELLGTMPGDRGVVNTISWSHDGGWVVVPDEEGPVRIWDPSSGEVIASIEAARGAWFAFPLEGDRSVASRDGDSVRIDRCEVCSSVDELVELARDRVTRELTEQEHREFLSVASGPVTEDEQPRPAGLESSDGEPVPDGELSAGTYSAVGFAPRVVFTVPDGWFAASDIGWADEDESQVAITLLLGEVDDPDVSLNLVYPEPGRLMDGWKEWDERRNVIPFAADFATWVDDHPHLELLGATPIDIGGVAGTSVDFRVTSLQTENLPPMCGECLPTFPITLRNQTGPLGNDLFAGAGLGSLERWMVLPTDEGTVVLQYWSYSRRGLDTVAAALEPVLETMEIGS